MEYRSFREWNATGRAVRQGQQAQFYEVNPDTHEGIAVFAEDQTEPIGTPEPAARRGWDRVPAADYRANKQPRSGPPRVLVEREADGTWTFWTGTNARLNKAFKQAGYQWDPRAWRWRSHGKVNYGPEKILKLLEDGEYTVVHTDPEPVAADTPEL